MTDFRNYIYRLAEGATGKRIRWDLVLNDDGNPVFPWRWRAAGVKAEVPVGQREYDA